MEGGNAQERGGASWSLCLFFSISFFVFYTRVSFLLNLVSFLYRFSRDGEVTLCQYAFFAHFILTLFIAGVGSLILIQHLFFINVIPIYSVPTLSHRRKPPKTDHINHTRTHLSKSFLGNTLPYLTLYC